MDSRNNPWKGLNFYVEGDMLYGRSREIDSLWQYIANNMQTVVYGKSGIGKTSLLNAGIFPRARQHGLTPVSIRLNHNVPDAYLDQIKNAIGKAGIVVSEQVAVKDAARETLWEYFHRNTFVDAHGRETEPLIVLDQFEEIFTLQTNERRRLDFFAELADLFNDVRPQYLSAESHKIKEEASFAAIDDTSDDLDMDADDIDLDDDETYGEDYVQDPAYHFVFIIREDFLSYLERYTAYIPVMKSNRFALLPLNEEQAAEIIMRPRPGLVSKDVAELIIQKVTGRRDFTLDGVPEIDVDSAILSLYLSRLYDKRTEGGVITSELVNQFGDNIIKDFYTDSIAGIAEATVEYLEDVLLTSSGRRNNVSRADLLAHGVAAADIAMLSDGRGGRRLLRVFSYGGDLRVEYIHDILCGVVAERKQQRAEEKLLKEAARKQKEAEAKAEALRIARNREYNVRKRKSALNVLTQKGRQLMDNALDIGKMRTNELHLDEYPGDFVITQQIISSSLASFLFEDKDSDGESYQIFSDPLLGNATYHLEFTNGTERASTIDGIYGVTLKYTHENISEIMFYGKGNDNGQVNYNSPVYIFGGYCGMRLKYDKHNREVLRTYLDDEGKPTLCKDLYTTIETTYDDSGHPVMVKYFDYTGKRRKPCRHKDGNHGFISTFDAGGNEVSRLFIDKKGRPTTIITGVYGKRMKYDPQTFCLTEICNTDADGNLMADNDGCAIERYAYDNSGRRKAEYYFDAEANPFMLSGNHCGGLFEVDDRNLVVRCYYIGENGEYASDGDGIYRMIALFNEKRQLVEYQMVGADGKPCGNMPCPIIRYAYNDANRAEQMIGFDASGRSAYDYAWDFDRKGIHVSRLWTLNFVGILDVDPEFGNGFHPVCGKEYVHGIAPDAPIQICFLDKNRKRIKCNQGYLLLGNWPDRDGNVLKSMYFDLEGKPMPDEEGVYGRIQEDTENGQIITMLDQWGRPMANIYGAQTQRIIRTEDWETSSYYDAQGKPVMQYDLFFEERTEKTKQGKNTIKTTKLLDTQGNLVDNMYVEEVYDELERKIRTCTKDSQGNIIENDEGDYVGVWEYSADGKIVSAMNFDALGNPRIGSEGWFKEIDYYDNKGRFVLGRFFDEKGQPAKAYGCYGKHLVYGNHTMTIIYLGPDGNPANNDEGVAYEYDTFDSKGLQLSERKKDVDGNIVGDSPVREYVNTEDGNGAYYIHWLDKDGNLCPDEGGVYYRYQEEDALGRIERCMNLDVNKKPLSDGDGDYGYVRHYEDFEDGSYRATTIYLDQDGKPHDNNLGYSRIVQDFDILERLKKEMFYTLDGKPYADTNGSYGYTYEYLGNGGKITGLLGTDGGLIIANNGIAYMEEQVTDDNFTFHWYYDKKKHPAVLIDGFSYGCYGQVEHQDEEGVGYLYWLDQRGEQMRIFNGAIVKKDIPQEDGTTLRVFDDEDDNHMPDEFGDYGTLLEQLYDGGERYTCLDEHGDIHNNRAGYAKQLNITDIAGNQFSIYYDADGRQVLPKDLPQSSREDKLNDNDPQLLYPRQMGAQGQLAILRQQGRSKQSMLAKGDYLVLNLGNWTVGDELDDIDKAMETMAPPDMRLIPIINKGDLLVLSGKVITMAMPSSPCLFDWKVRKELLDKIKNIANQADDGDIALTFNRYTGE